LVLAEQKEELLLCGKIVAVLWILLTSTRAHFPLEGNKQILPQKGSDTLKSDICENIKTEVKKHGAITVWHSTNHFSSHTWNKQFWEAKTLFQT